tara:strand:+ start:904 stop:2019 length:1116 start_codon:yes stop_codon:yes gene_type:complete
MKVIEKKIINFLKEDPYEISFDYKKKEFLEILKLQIHYHKKNCLNYRIWYENNKFKNPDNINNIDEIPYVPSSIFKKINLSSSKKLNRIISSSGSSGEKSTINIDKKTSLFQRTSLLKILSNNLNNERKIFFIVDVEPLIKTNELNVSARMAGMSGYLMASNEKNYLLKFDKNKKLVIDYKQLSKLIKINKKNSVVIIGYTYMIWMYLIKAYEFNYPKLKLNKNTKFIHFGGWKKLEEKKISKSKFLLKINKNFNIKKENILDIYGFSEQLGTVYVSKGSSGCRVPSYAHVLVRDTKTLQVINDGKPGFLQFLSILPLSYPGFSILNDDIGYISRKSIVGQIEKIEFKVKSRLANLEPRGCGDTLPKNYYV